MQFEQKTSREYAVKVNDDLAVIIIKQGCGEAWGAYRADNNEFITEVPRYSEDGNLISDLEWMETMETALNSIFNKAA